MLTYSNLTHYYVLKFPYFLESNRAFASNFALIKLHQACKEGVVQDIICIIIVIEDDLVVELQH